MPLPPDLAGQRARARERDPLVHQGGDRDVPAVALGPDAHRVGDAHVVEEHLVELGVAGDLHERPHLDARRVHVDDEVREPAVLRARRGSVRASNIPHRDRCASVVHTFWPLTTHSSPSRTARVESPATSEPAPGSENSWHQISSFVAMPRSSWCFCSSVPHWMSVGPPMPMPMMLNGRGTL